MLNKIVCDKDLNVELVINIQAPRTFDDTWDNSIIISIDADDTANQSLYVNAEQATATYLITPSQINDIEIETEYWNMGGASTITLRKGSTAYGTITINFPDEIDSLGMLNRDENIETTFTMTGSFNDPSDIATKVEEKQDKLVAGSGISIEGNVISATGGGGGGGGVNYSTTEQDTGLIYNDNPRYHVMQQTFIIPITSAGQQLIQLRDGIGGPILESFGELSFYISGTKIGLTLPLYNLSYYNKTWQAFVTQYSDIAYLQINMPSEIGSFYYSASFIITLRYVKVV